MSRQLWLLTGGNGAGKTTFYRLYLQPRGLPILSVDDVALRMQPDNPDAAVAEAQHRVEAERSRLLKTGEAFCYETVFSHPSRIDFVADARAQGYNITLIYIHLSLVDLNLARVQQRVTEGGHDVPPDRIATRIPRTMRHVATAITLSNRAHLLDNSSYADPFRTVATVRDGRVVDAINPLPDWAEAMLRQVL